MSPLGDDSATRTAKVLSLPTRAAILSALLHSGPKTVKEIAETFDIHPNVARAHLDLMVESGFLMTETRRRDKGRPAKVFWTLCFIAGLPRMNTKRAGRTSAPARCGDVSG